MRTVWSRIAVPVGVVALAVGAAVPAAAAGPAPQVTPAVAAAANATPGSFVPLDETEVFDSRPGGHIPSGGTRTFKVGGVGTGVPPTGASAVVLSVTVPAPTSGGYVTLYSGDTRPVASTVNFTAGHTTTNLAVVPVLDNTPITVYAGAPMPVDTRVVVTGYFRAGSGAEGSFATSGLQRIVDTDTTASTAPDTSVGPIPGGGYKSFRVAGANGVPASAGGAIVNVTVVGGDTDGQITVGTGSTRPATTTISLRANETLSDLAMVDLASDGTFSVFNTSTSPVRVVVDLSGWFIGRTSRTPALWSVVRPFRAYDTVANIGSGSPLGRLENRMVGLGGKGGVPDGNGALAVMVTVTVPSPNADGALSVFAGTKPSVPTLPFSTGITATVSVIVPMLSGGSIALFNDSTRPNNVIVDVSGYVRLPVAPGSVSHDIQSVSATAAQAAIVNQFTALGKADAQAAAAGKPQVVLLQFGAQTADAGGTGTGDGTTRGVRQDGSGVRLTYAQVLSAVRGYVAGYRTGQSAPKAAVTVVVGTSSAGFAGSSYTAAARGTDWWASVVGRAVAVAAGTGITVVGGNDIEANHDGTVAQVTAWMNAYLAAAPAANPVVNTGTAAGCSSIVGQTGANACNPVQIDGAAAGQKQAFQLADLYAVSGGMAPARQRVLPQIYDGDSANQWENVDLVAVKGGAPLSFAGVLTAASACAPPDARCRSIDPQSALNVMNAALAGRPPTATTISAVTDLAVY